MSQNHQVPSGPCPETDTPTNFNIVLSPEAIAENGLRVIKAMAIDIAEGTAPGAESASSELRLQQANTLAHGLVSLLTIFDEAGIRLHVPAVAGATD